MSELPDFFPATSQGFQERAGTVAKLTSDDFADEHKRRHLESFRETMSAWQNFDKKINDDLKDERYLEFLKSLREFVQEKLNSESSLSQQEFDNEMRRLRKRFKFAPSKSQMGRAYIAFVSKGDIEALSSLEAFLVKRQVRTASGVAVITVLTSPGVFSCPMDCYYCPNEPGQPRSYLSTEPAVLRANQCGWDPARQFWDRAQTLLKNGHIVDKVEILVLGGTWSNYTSSYQEEFVRDIFYAANELWAFLKKEKSLKGKEDLEVESYVGEIQMPSLPPLAEIPKGMRPRLSLVEEQTLNENAVTKLIGLTLETRPDFINFKELQKLRYYGCTRVQIGVQHTNDEILRKINRGCKTEQVVKAIKLLKDSCFKVDIHLMPDLPGSSIELDRKMFNQVLFSKGLQADQWKIYPCEVTPFSKISEWYKAGEYLPYSEKNEAALIELILQVKRLVFPWIRLNRVVRDIPNQSIIAGNSKTNLRQLLEVASSRMGWRCECMRCKEVRCGTIPKGTNLEGGLRIRTYETEGGSEYFLSFEEMESKTLYGFLRLRLRTSLSEDLRSSPFEFIRDSDCALIRELHVYGMLVSSTSSKKEKPLPQHSGLGKDLIAAAEMLALRKGFKKMAIIAGVGTRNYYRKFGYRLESTFMVKDLEEEKVSSFFNSRDRLKNSIHFEIDDYDFSKYPRVESVEINSSIVSEVLLKGSNTSSSAADVASNISLTNTIAAAITKERVKLSQISFFNFSVFGGRSRGGVAAMAFLGICAGSMFLIMLRRKIKKL